MRQVKQCWDPEGLFNRHKIVDTLPMDSMLRFEEEQQYKIEQLLGTDQTYFNWKAAFGECTAPGATGANSQTHALMCTIEQCNGSGDCRKSNIIGGTMCPAFKVSGDELKTTRARANVLREILTRGGEWTSIKEILDPDIDPEYTLSDKLWQYLQNYAEKHRAKGNGFGYGLVDLNGISRTLSARYYKDGSEILIPQGNGMNPRKLSPRECARLMGYPDNYILSAVSDVQAYRQCGNSVIVPLITAVSEQLVNTMQGFN
jgi:hypothetical protein